MPGRRKKEVEESTLLMLKEGEKSPVMGWMCGSPKN